jgi:hypothetical protein
VRTHPARRVWATLEALHGVTYFTPEVREVGVELGLRGFWMTYFAFRAAPLGPVPAGPVIAMFAGFCPAMVAKALPDAWSRSTPQACIDARLAVTVTALRRIGADPDACGRAVSLLRPVAEAADPTGRPLFAANAELPLPDDPVGGLWQLATCLREHRGDGHIAALVTEGITGLQAHLLQLANGRYPEQVIKQARGWPEEDWDTAAGTLRGAGLLTPDGAPTLTAAGRELLDRVESSTDERAWTGALAVLGEQGAEDVVSLLEPSVQAVVASGILPDISPGGLRLSG